MYYIILHNIDSIIISDIFPTMAKQRSESRLFSNKHEKAKEQTNIIKDKTKDTDVIIHVEDSERNDDKVIGSERKKKKNDPEEIKKNFFPTKNTHTTTVELKRRKSACVPHLQRQDNTLLPPSNHKLRSKAKSIERAVDVEKSAVIRQSDDDQDAMLTFKNDIENTKSLKASLQPDNLTPGFNRTRRKSETPSCHVTADHHLPSLLPFTRRQSQCPPSLESDLTTSLNRLAIGKEHIKLPTRLIGCWNNNPT